MKLSLLHENIAPNAYTLGHTESYDQALREGPVKKSGKKDGYEGGWVFKTAEEAEEFNKRTQKGKGYSVYGLILPNSWEEDVSENPAEDGIHTLLNSAMIVKI